MRHKVYVSTCIQRLFKSVRVSTQSDQRLDFPPEGTLDGWRLPKDWLQSLKQFFINVSYYMPLASLTLMALFKDL